MIAFGRKRNGVFYISRNERWAIDFEILVCPICAQIRLKHILVLGPIFSTAKYSVENFKYALNILYGGIHIFSFRTNRCYNFICPWLESSKFPIWNIFELSVFFACAISFIKTWRNQCSTTNKSGSNAIFGWHFFRTRCAFRKLKHEWWV